MRNWNTNIGGIEITAETIYNTYEELKHVSSAVPPTYALRFIIPMRNWNVSLTLIDEISSKIYNTYEELKLK